MLHRQGDANDHQRHVCPRHHRPGPRLLGDPPQLGGLDQPTTRPRASASSPPPTPASRSRSRRSTRTRRRSRTSPCPPSSTTSRRHRRARPPPIIMGHSAGGVFTQILIDHGYGAAGVAINSAPTEGVRVVPPSQLKSTFPVLKNPANRHKAVGFTFEQWHYAFTNTFPEDESRAAVRALRHPGVGADPVGQRARQLPARPPGHLGRLPQRRPGAAAVHLGQRRPPHAAQRSSGRTPSTTSRTRSPRSMEYDGPAPAAVPGGWEEVADYALDWALEPRAPGHARQAPAPAHDDVRITHIGGPTVLIEVGGWRILTDPTFDPPGRRYPSAGGRRPAS